MKVKIEYEFSPNLANKFVAFAAFDGERLCAVSRKSFEEAKELAIRAVQNFLRDSKTPVPEPEEVEVQP